MIYKRLYRILHLSLYIFAISFFICGCTREESFSGEGCQWSEMNVTGSLLLEYADRFSVDYYEGDYTLITIADKDRYLIVPENMSVPSGLDEDITVIKKTIGNIYLAATSAMDLLVETGSLASVKFSGTEADGWYIEEARAAMEEGSIIYAGRYSAPDFELLLDGGCDLAIESTMILHNPEVKEQLENVGIPVLVEYSSYESDPLGRMEWIKLYGILTDHLEEAEEYFNAQAAKVSGIMDGEDTGLTVAFFYVTSNGTVNVRKSSDYVSKMIELAGGKYIFDDIGSEEDNALSTVTIQMEEFYAAAKDADILIYNSTISGPLSGISELLDMSPLFKDFKAYKDGRVYCTEKNMFQESTGIGDMITDIHKILVDENVTDDELVYLYKLD